MAADRGGRPPSRRPTGGDGRGAAGGTPRGSTSGRPTRGRPGGGKSAGSKSDGSRGRSSGTAGRSSSRTPDRRERRADPRADRGVDQKTYDGPPIPDEIEARQLDKHVRRGLNGLPDKLADRVARHLVMAGELIDDDPETAYQHAQAARARATRVAVVREACGETAYATQRFAEALSELRAAKRLNGAWHYLPMMADCERALKRPERALKLAADSDARQNLDEGGQVELSIVAAGARRDLGQTEAALQILEAESLHSQSRDPWVARLRYAYADALDALGRTDEAIQWFHRTVAVDGNKATDAEERLHRLEGSEA